MESLILVGVAVVGVTGIMQVIATARIQQDVRELTRRRDLQRLQDLADMLNRIRRHRNLLPMLMKVAQATTTEDSEMARMMAEGKKILEDMQARLPKYDAFEDDEADDDLTVDD